MHRRTEPAAIGAFIVGAVLLVVAAALLWGSRAAFQETTRFVCYFDGSIEGLEVGAPVKARGVPVGRVVRIQLRYRQRADDQRVPVFIEVNTKRLVDLGAQRLQPQLLKALIAGGLRARLESQSLVTGTLFVNFGQFPGTPARFSEIDPQGGYPEVPTVPRQLAQFSESLTAIISKIEHADFPALVRAFTNAAASVDRLASSTDLPKAIARLNTTLAAYQKLGRNLDGELTPLLAEARATVEDARRAIVGLDSAASATARLVAPHAPLSTEVSQTLGQLNRAAEAVRDLAEYLQRNPSSLIVGKGQ